MAAIAHNLRTGSWLERDRLVVYPLMILVVTALAIGYVLWSNGGRLPNGSPFGSDFVSFWVAAREALAGRPMVPYGAAQFAAAQDALFGDGNFYAFFYPPHFLLYMLPFGALPYYSALALWMGLSFAAAAAVVYLIANRRLESLLLALAFPATFLTLAHGQNAFLSAALFGGGLYLLPKRPVLAGILFGLLTFKPQLGLLIPVALLAGGHWRTILAAVASTVLVALLSGLVFGFEVWGMFLSQGDYAFAALRDGLVGWNKMISPYAMMRLYGIPHIPAFAAQCGISLLVAAAVGWAWLGRQNVGYASKSALLLTGALLATPFGLNYDIFILAPAMAFIAARGLRDGFAPYELTLLALIFMTPLAMLMLMADGIAFAPVLVALLFIQQFANIWRAPIATAEPARS